MQKYDYYLRMDDDLYLIDPIMADPFATMAASGCEYGYGHVTEDIKQVNKVLKIMHRSRLKANSHDENNKLSRSPRVSTIPSSSG